MNIKTQVAIIGGGPAGSALAIFLRQRGIDCVIFEKEKFPRFHVGESLLPESMVMFEKLGIMDEIRAAGFIPKPGATFIYDQCDYDEAPSPPATIHFRNALFGSPPAAVNVKRAEFDDLLLRKAAAAGAVVHEECAVTDLLRHENGRVTGLTALLKDGTAIHCDAEFVADCSGQGSFVAKRMGVWGEDPEGHARAAFMTQYTGVRREAAPDEGNAVLVFGEQRWYWLIPLNNGITSIGVVVSKDLLARHWQGDAARFYDDMMAQSPELLSRMKSAERIEIVRTIQNYSYESSRYSGDGWVLIGDAAAFLDPIFSTGISIALHGADMAAASIAKGLATGDRSAALFASYEKKIRAAQRFYKPFIYGWYTRAFQRTFRQPRRILLIMPSLITMLAGDVFNPWKRAFVRIWLPIFWLGVWGEKREMAKRDRR